jgi:hypothetical protein
MAAFTINGFVEHDQIDSDGRRDNERQSEKEEACRRSSKRTSLTEELRRRGERLFYVYVCNTMKSRPKHTNLQFPKSPDQPLSESDVQISIRKGFDNNRRYLNTTSYRFF